MRRLCRPRPRHPAKCQSHTRNSQHFSDKLSAHFADIPASAMFSDGNGTVACKPFQTFNFTFGAETRIQCLLLDRFLACMKPASTLNARLARAFFLAPP